MTPVPLAFPMSNSIVLSNGESLEVRVVDRVEFYRGRFSKDLARQPTLDEFYNEDAFYDEKRTTEDLLRHALSKRWVNNDDFAVGSDSNFAFTLCGGIYSTRMICREYLETLHGVISSTRHRDHWAYDTAVELPDPPDQMTTINFVLQRNCLTVLDWGLGNFSFVAQFSKPFAVRGRQG